MLRKITTCSSVKYVSKIDHSRSKESPDFSNMRKTKTFNSIELPQEIKNLNKNITKE